MGGESGLLGNTVAFYLCKIDNGLFLIFQAQVAEDLANYEKYTTGQKQVRNEYESTSNSHGCSLELNRTLRAKIECYRDIFAKLLSASGNINSNFPKIENIVCLKPLTRKMEIVTPNIKARATVYSQQVKAKGI